MLYVEFTLGQSQEQFLNCHENAFRFFKGVPARVMVDNCKTFYLVQPGDTCNVQIDRRPARAAQLGRGQQRTAPERGCRIENASAGFDQLRVCLATFDVAAAAVAQERVAGGKEGVEGWRGRRLRVSYLLRGAHGHRPSPRRPQGAANPNGA